MLVISLLLQRSENGLALGELVKKIQSRLGAMPELRVMFDRNIATTLGSSLKAALHERFDARYAASNLRLYAARDIPSVPPGVPLEVSNIRFVSDITNIATMGANEAKVGLFAEVALYKNKGNA